jgi:methylated-DNA-[protein]-cysteine S-methyltransferase
MKSTYYSDTFSTIAGDFSVALDESGAVVATAFGGVSELRKRFRSDVLVPNARRTAAVRSQVQEFLKGKRTYFDVRLSPKGTAFQKRVWTELQRIPFGHTRSYAQLAAAVGRPKAARAVGRANATNPICLLVPCHRVVGADGSLTGFAFGQDLKRRLLELERSAIKTASEPLYQPRSKVPGPRVLQSPCRVSAA